MALSWRRNAKDAHLDTDADAFSYIGHQYAWIGWDEISQRPGIDAYKITSWPGGKGSGGPQPGRRGQSRLTVEGVPNPGDLPDTVGGLGVADGNVAAGLHAVLSCRTMRAHTRAREQRTKLMN